MVFRRLSIRNLKEDIPRLHKNPKKLPPRLDKRKIVLIDEDPEEDQDTEEKSEDD